VPFLEGRISIEIRTAKKVRSRVLNSVPKTKISSRLAGKRFYVVLFLFFNVAINYMDRVNLSVAAPTIAKHFHWDPAQMGWVFSAYIWTYAACLLPDGWLADRIGARRIFAIAISVWSAAAILTGAASNIWSMIAARLALGVGESTSFPVCNKVVRQWFPAGERAFATALFHSGVFASIALGSPLVAWLVLSVGWRASFVITGSLGFVWLLCWLLWFQPPEKCEWLSAAERQLILDNRDGGPRTSRLILDVRPQSGIGYSLGSLLRQQSVWGLALTMGTVNYMNYLFLTWLPSYLVQARGMNLMRAGFFSSMPYIAGILVEIVFGNLSDRTLTPERLKQGGRRNQSGLLIILSSVILLINYARSNAAAIAVISIALACNTTVIALLYALTNDLIEDPKIAGTVFGVVVLGGNLFGLLAPILTGYIVRATGSFNGAFAISGALSLIGASISFLFTRRPITGSVQIGIGEPVLHKIV
jgi:ACS family glucarate transporter-like MFS transporter